MNNVKSQIVELEVDAGSTLQRFNFTLQNFLRQKKIISLEIYSNVDMPLAPSGNILPTAANIGSGYLTLYGQNPEQPTAMGEWLQRIPLWSMHRINNLNNPFVFELYTLVPRVIVWEKSFIEVTAALGNASNLSWVFNVGYIGNEGDGTA